MNLPNKLTLARIAMIPAFLLLAVPLPELGGGPGAAGAAAWAAQAARAARAYNGFIAGAGWWLAGAVFVLAFATDAADGYIARSRGLVTDLGKFLDPLADKLLVSAALVLLVERGELSCWVAAAIIAREFAVTGLRAVAAGKGVVIAADRLGKAKTLCQAAALTLMLFEDFRVPALAGARAGHWLMMAALALTLASGANYLYKNRALLA